mmetsp:Transcript_7412/g.19776  ORF Transcript_7412/g.19776 Transcript_7412/m.19776 type:complete len:494 (-) Transcript_7412:479-1960(-)|eukprot:CAMPEP_0202423608 /NCGR_PEP_ID=MMETSP1128-20130828/51469_1 /ASSEMBLY_ACC=CAM_ASM_000463 /TAXON_ID=3047 /ORGANISM="Dunaliella tertiolecta, Strain CCMP1320" /LENGTH=493 /DNA_ID=CAMNT_0049031725 /DNA_START=1301 /DNA_END=2782 /DNA_ORIENTATION=-
MKGPFAGRRTAAEGVLYPRYESVQDIVEGKFSASPSPAPVSRANAQPSKPACKDVAPSSTQPSTTLVVDKMELSVEERKRLKREKRALRRVNVEDGANNNNAGQSEGAAQGAGAPASPEPGSKASKKEEKKRKRAEQQQQQQGEVEGGGGSMAGAAAAQQQQQQQQQQAEEAPAAVGKKAKGNAEEARRIREALGYVPPANSNAAAAAAAAEKSAAAKAAAPAQAGSRFTFGFNIQQQKESETDAKIARLMALDATKDGYVARRVWLCGMPHEYSEDDVRAYWEECGPIESMDLLRFKDSGRFNGAAFITFRTEEAYASALACNGLELEGRRLKVDKCKTIVPKSQQQQQFNPEQAQHLAMHNGVGSTVLPPSSSQRHSPGPAATAPAPAAVAVPALSAQQGTQQQESDEHVAYIGNVAFEATEEDLQGLFAPFSCTLIRLHKDKNSGRPKGFAHAHFGDRASLDRAVAGVDGASLHDRNLKVAVAAPKKNKS